jgi:hypothetical protein
MDDDGRSIYLRVYFAYDNVSWVVESCFRSLVFSPEDSTLVVGSALRSKQIFRDTLSKLLLSTLNSTLSDEDT